MFIDQKESKEVRSNDFDRRAEAQLKVDLVNVGLLEKEAILSCLLFYEP